jgi:hypothetical protein
MIDGGVASAILGIIDIGGRMTDQESFMLGAVTFYAFLCTIAVTTAIGICAYEGARRRWNWMIHGQKAAGEYRPRKQQKPVAKNKNMTVLNIGRTAGAR